MTTLTRQLVVGTAACAAAYWMGQVAVRRLRRFDFHGRTVLITGGSRGLGLVLARQLVDFGARVAICARDEGELERAREELIQRGGEVIALRCDVMDQLAVKRLVSAIHDAWGPIDVLINNAGVIRVGPQEEMTREDYEQAINVHYWGPLNTTLAVLPEMRRRASGRIVNIASIGGLVSVPHLHPYCASKFALVGLSEGFRAELIKDGIYVTTVCPGLMRTGSTMNAQFKGQNEAEYAWFATSASTPLVSMSAEGAAARILAACRDGRAQLVLSFPAKLAEVLHGIAPGLVSDAFGMANRLLPGPGGIGTARARGAESRPRWLPRLLTILSDRAARRNNELDPSVRSGEARV